MKILSKLFLKTSILSCSIALALGMTTNVMAATNSKVKATTPSPKTLTTAELTTIKNISKEIGVSEKDLQQAALKATKQDVIIKTMERPWEAKPWYKYWPIFIIPKRVNEGVDFWHNNKNTMLKAEQTYGVPPQIITAIIGVETFYGKNMGTFKVLDALYTLGFYYPKRSAYFSKEFGNFVKLAKQEKWNYDDIKGSYAGAMGMGQFMPYSYLTWAVDFNNNGHTNLFKEKDDAIGSVANYFKKHNWQHNGPVVHKLNLTPKQESNTAQFINDSLELNHTVAELRKAGFNIPGKYKDTEPCSIIKLQEEVGFSYYVIFNNFYTISRYNKSPLYSLTVYLLSEEIQKHM